jgi:hypothetical protein
MAKTLHLGRIFVLLAVGLGLNTLCFLISAHGHHAAKYSRSNYEHVPPHGPHRPTGRGSRSQRLSVSDHGASDHFEASSVAPRSKSTHPITDMHAAVLLPAGLVLQNNLSSEPLAAVSVVALGSAPRAPGNSRGPPRS